MEETKCVSGELTHDATQLVKFLGVEHEEE